MKIIAFTGAEYLNRVIFLHLWKGRMSEKAI